MNMTNENDGIRYPSIDQLSKKTDSKYKLVIGAAKRAKEINAGDEVLVKNPKSKFQLAGKAFEAPYIYKRGQYYYLFAF